MVLGGEEIEVRVRKTMDLFDIRYIYMDWDDVLKGKKVFAGDVLQLLRGEINDNVLKAIRVESSGGDAYPFRDEHGTLWGLVYYDPNYECKVAYKQGKTIQFRYHGEGDSDWADCTGVPKWLGTCEYRVKPKEPAKKWRPFKDISELKQAWDIKRSPLVHPELEEPAIWVRDKERPDITRLITDFNGGSKTVALAGQWYMFDALFEEYEFLDGTPCGVEE